jgi:peptidoglycan/LPS O-acetylase OafA/YrhL
VEEHFYLFWPFVVFMLARRPRALIAACLGIAAVAMLARVVGTLLGYNWWSLYVLSPFRLDGLALGAALAVVMRQSGGLHALTRALPSVAAVTGGLMVLTFVWSRFGPGRGLELILPIRAALIQVLLACLVLWALVAPDGSQVSRFFRHRVMTVLGTYSYGLYVYHHFISYYLASNRIEFEIARWLGSHSAAVVLQAAAGAAASFALAYVSYEYFEKRFLGLKGMFEAPREATSKAP